MPEYFGVTGKLLKLDMTTEQESIIELPEDVYKTHIGGIALGCYHMFKEGIVSPDVSPFDPKNIMALMCGPLNGVVPGVQTVQVGKAPHNFITVSYSGGLVNGEIKFAGYDGVIVTGKASDLLWVSIVDDQVEFHDASELKGKLTDETEYILQQKIEALSPLEYRKARMLTKEDTPTGKDANGNAVSMWDWWGVRPSPPYAIGEKRMVKVVSIGPAGENQVWAANTMTEGNHAHGRYGAGCIWGSKNLKAITVRGTQGHKLANKTRTIELIRAILDTQKKQASWRTYGTARVPALANNYEDAYPIRNYQYMAWHDPRAVTGFTGSFLDDMSWVKHDSCCPVGCQICMKTSRLTHDDPDVNGCITDMVDWEAQGNVGGLMDFAVPEDMFPGKTPADPWLGSRRDMAECGTRMLYITNLHDRLGLDYIEGGAHMGLMMELRERGLITAADLKLPSAVGDLKWGNYKAAAWVMRQFSTQKGAPWDDIKKGTYMTAEYFANLKNNPEIRNYDETTKRYGQPAHDPRSGRCKGPSDYIQTERPDAHTEGRGDAVPQRAGVGCLVGCTFALTPLGGNAGLAELVAATTGWSFSEADFITLSERAFNLERVFNLVTNKVTDPPTQWDGTWPKRWLEPLPTGWAAGQPSNVTEAKIKEELDAFWAARGWNTKGYPTAQTLQNLGISYADDWMKQYRS